MRYADDSDDSLCHIQLWTAGVGVSAGFHNHAGKSFCEIHACIVNGTGAGGMYWAKQGVKDEDFDAANPDRKQYEGLTVPTMSEHGPLWRTGKDGLPMLRANDTVDYPWHGERGWPELRLCSERVAFQLGSPGGLRASRRASMCGSHLSSRRSSRASNSPRRVRRRSRAHTASSTWPRT